MANVLLRINLDNKIVKSKDTFDVVQFDTPNRVENYTASTILPILFNTDGSITGETCHLRLWKAGVLVEWIIASHTITTSNNLINYTIPATANGGDYYIEIEIISKSPSWYVYSDVFSVGNYNRYFSTEGYTDTFTFDVKDIDVQWPNDILSMSNISKQVGDDNNYQASQVNLSLKNTNSYWNDILMDDDTRFLYGNDCELYDIDGNSIGKYRLISWDLNINSTDIVLSDRYGDFLNEPLNGVELITESLFPDAPTGSINKYIPMTYGNFRQSGLTADDGKNTIRAYRVDKSATAVYCFGKSDYAVTTFASGNYNVFLPDGTEVTGSCSNVLLDGINYINYTATTEDYLDVNFTNSTIASPHPTTEILWALNSLFSTYNLDYSAVFSNYFDIDDFKYDDEYYIAKWHYAIDDNRTGIDVLKDICKGLGLEYYIDGDDIVLKALNPASITVDHYFQEGEILTFDTNIDFDKMFNSVKYQTGFTQSTNSYDLLKTSKNYEGIRNWGKEKQKELSFNNFYFERNNIGTNQFWRTYTPVKKLLMEFMEPKKEVVISMALSKISDVELLEIISFPYASALTTTNRNYQVRGMSKNYTDNLAILTLKDITFFDNLENKQTVLINSNDVDGSEIFWNDAVNGYNDVTGDNVENSTDYLNFGISSLHFEKARTSFLKIGDIDDNIKLNMCNTSNTTDFNFEFYLCIKSVGSGETIYDHYVDSNNYLRITKTSGNILRFRIRSGGVTVITLDTTTTIVGGRFYHYNICKVGSDWGIYHNGAQEAYVSDSNSYNFNDGAYIGVDSTTVAYLDGYIDGLEINFRNKYSLAPVVGLTDSFTLPTVQQGFYKQT